MDDAPNHIMSRFRRMMNLETGPQNASAPFPDVVGHYRILRVLGTGASAVVCEAEDLTLKRRVALKILRAGDEGEALLARFHREASLAAGLKHPHLVTIHEVAMVRQPDGTPLHYIVMDCVPRTLRDVIEQSGTPDPAAAARLIATIARAIHHAHEKKIIHRDLKPANILIDDAGRPIVTDFGLAKEISDAASLTRSGAAVGTPLYMSPEQVAGRSREIGPATDIYALGAILYELLTSRPPFEGETVGEIYAKILRDPPGDARATNRAVPAELSAVCRKALEKDPAARYASAEALAQDLDRFLAGQSVLAMKTHLISQIGRALRRNPSRIAAGITAVAVLVLGLAYGLHSAERNDEWKRLLGRAGEEVSNYQKMDSLSAGYLEARKRTRATIDELLALDRGQIEAHLLLIRFLMHGSKNTDVTPAVEEAVRLDPDNPRVLYWSGVTRLLEHLYALPSWSAEDPPPPAEFITSIRRDLERLDGAEGIQPYELELTEGLLALSERRFGDATARLSRFLEVERANTQALEFRGVARKLGGDLEGALRDYNEVIRAFPTTRTRWLLAEVHLESGNATAALADLEQASPDYALTWYARGNAFMKLGRKPEAIGAYTRAIALDPKGGVGHVWRAWARRESGDLEGALSDCEQALKADPSRASAILERGKIRIASQEWELAVIDCGRAAASLNGRNRAEARALQAFAAYHIEGTQAKPDWNEVIRLCDAAIEEHAALAGPHVIRAMARYETIRLQTAPAEEAIRKILADARRYLDLAPDGPQAGSAAKLHDDALKRLGARQEH